MMAGTPPNRDARTLYPVVKTPDQLRAELVAAERRLAEDNQDTNAAELRRLQRVNSLPLEDALEAEIKVMLSYPVGGDGPHAMRVSERTALITAGVKLLAVKAKLPPEVGGALDADDAT